MFKKETFDKKYSLLNDIFTDQITRDNLMENEDFARKYHDNNAIIKIFIFELSKRFELDVIRKILIDIIREV